MTETVNKKTGNIIIENREKLTAGGVRDVESFSPEKIVIVTENSLLTVTGNSMKVKKLSTQSGEIYIEGEITGCVYSAQHGERESFLRRMLK
ncbi:MAG: sporulation protein YabP [Clostridia bacterium]|nr:sporulation protein YabP [Clostridia bacterium]